MAPDDLRAAFEALNLRQYQAAMLLGVTQRAVGMWVNGEREVPGPVSAYVNLLLSLPGALRAQELAKLQVQEDPAMIEGMYRVDFNGFTGAGIAILVFQGGRIFGSDTQVQFDGTYEPTGTPGEVTLHVTVNVPPGVDLVQGMNSGHRGFSYDIREIVDLQSQRPVTVQTPIGGPRGKVTARLSRLRGLPN